MKYDSFYHYTNVESLRSIFNDCGALTPRRRFICLGDAQNMPDKAHDSVIWGMLSPRPDEYVKNHWHKGSSFFEDCLGRARSHLKPTFMIKAALLPEDDVYVADWSVHFREDFKGTEMKNRRIIHETKKAYWESLIPLSDYREGMYKLPEVICFNPIPASRLSIEKVIPGSEMERYIKTGCFDSTALGQDQTRLRQGRDQQDAFLSRNFHR